MSRKKNRIVSKVRCNSQKARRFFGHADKTRAASPVLFDTFMKVCYFVYKFGRNLFQRHREGGTEQYGKAAGGKSHSHHRRRAGAWPRHGAGMRPERREGHHGGHQRGEAGGVRGRASGGGPALRGHKAGRHGRGTGPGGHRRGGENARPAGRSGKQRRDHQQGKVSGIHRRRLRPRDRPESALRVPVLPDGGGGHGRAGGRSHRQHRVGGGAERRRPDAPAFTPRPRAA